LHAYNDETDVQTCLAAIRGMSREFQMRLATSQQ
jgi:hypothetical protein